MQSKRAFYFQRQFKRRAIQVPVGTICRDKGGFETALELSEGGLLVRSEFDYRVGDKAEVSFFIPELRFVSEVGEVVYIIEGQSNSRLVGMRFTHASPESVETIRAYIELDTIQTPVAKFRSKPSDLIYGTKASKF